MWVWGRFSLSGLRQSRPSPSFRTLLDFGKSSRTSELRNEHWPPCCSRGDYDGTNLGTCCCFRGGGSWRGRGGHFHFSGLPVSHGWGTSHELSLAKIHPAHAGLCSRRKRTSAACV